MNKKEPFPYPIPRLAPGDPPDYERLAKGQKAKDRKGKLRPRITDEMLKRFGYNL